MATVKQLQKTVDELQEQIITLTKQVDALSTLGGRVSKMSDTIADISRQQTNSNKRIQSDIQRIVERMSTTRGL